MLRMRVQLRTKRTAIGSYALLAVVVGGSLSGGCGLDVEYLTQAVGGQVNIFLQSVSLDRAIDSGGLTDEQVSKLELIRDAREYASEVIGLTVGGNYAKFYDSGGQPVAFNVSACRKDAFEPRRWTFPIVGILPYLGFFSRSAADAKVSELAAEGLDVLMYEVDAYSGLDYFPSVVLSPMLERTDISITETVFHELLHSTIWRVSDVPFNESLATFFGRTGALDFLATRFPDRPDLVQRAVETFEDTDRYSDFALTLFDDLDEFYSSDLSSDEKIAGRETVYQAGRDRFEAEVQPLMNCPECYDWVASLPTNNAYTISVRRYNLDLDVFEDVFEATGEDWAAALQVFRNAAAEADPYAYLLAWLDSPGDTSVRVSAETAAKEKEWQTHVDPPVDPTPLRRGPCPAHQATTIYNAE